MTLLTKRQAEESVITRLKSRCADGEISLAEWRGSASAIPRWVIVNKHSQQVVASSLASDVEQFVRLYEKLLAQNQTRSQGWCGTLPLPFPWSLWRKRTVAERAREGGFYEIGGKEGEP
jgi:hypothetical protein